MRILLPHPPTPSPLHGEGELRRVSYPSPKTETRSASPHGGPLGTLAGEGSRFARGWGLGIFLLMAALCTPLAAVPAAKYIPSDAVQPTAPWKIAAVDFLLPGYGTFAQNKTAYAAVYFSANLASLSVIYLTYRNWRFYESAYQAAAVRQASEPDLLHFQNPTGGGDYLTLQDIKNRAERGQLFFALSIVANIALRVFSAAHTWSLADESATKAGPRYEFYPEPAGGMRAQAGYYFYY